MKNYNEKLEKNLIEMVKQKEESDKRMLKLEYVLGYVSTITFLILIFVASYIQMEGWVKAVLIVIGIIILGIGGHYCIKIEQTAGYYECKKCYHKYIPTYSSVLYSMHFGRTRYMKCPKCNKKSWQKKVISKE